MNSYGPLADYYDALTNDVLYSAYADIYEAEFRRDGGEFRLLLDLCCGTGSLSSVMSLRGYEMISVDASADMLMQAQSKPAGETSPLFLCQRAQDLDLYGTVDAAYSSLDSLNYIPTADLPGIFHRLYLFIRPGGRFIFDIRTPEWLRATDGQVFVDERDNILCLWRAEYSKEDNALTYGLDLFTRRGRLWQRDCEEHIEYSHDPELLKNILTEAGFEDIRLLTGTPDEGQGRAFYSAMRSLN